MKRYVGVALACMLGIGSSVTVAQTAVPSASHELSIASQPLSSALRALAEQTGIQVVFFTEVTEGRQAPALTGRYSLQDAIGRLLEGSGLDYRFLDDEGSITIHAPQAEPSAGVTSRYTGIEEVIVTGQKREERIQDVPIAISAFSMDALDAQKIEGGFDLLKSVPNVTFSKTNFTGYNFQIRGIGTQAISATTDPGVAVSFNNTTLIVNRLFEQEYLDIERVEVLRGPQGTLYGRNATAGVINVISAKPRLGELSGEYKIEFGNYNAKRARMHVNVPVGETVAARAAFAFTERDGYGNNLASGMSFSGRDPVEGRIDDRSLWTGRFSLGWQPSDRLRANIIYERFEENDSRMRSTKQLCHHDPGEVTLYDHAGMPISLIDAIPAAQKNRNRFDQFYHSVYRAQFTQGCLPGSLYDTGSWADGVHGAYGTPNGNAIPFVRAGRGTSFFIGTMPFPGDQDCTDDRLVSNCMQDPLEVVGGQSRNLRDIYSLLDPEYRALSEIIEVSVDFELSDDLMLSSQTVYAENDLYSTQDFLRFLTAPMFGDSSSASGDYILRRGVTPGGILTDPQLGPSDRLLMQDVSQQRSRQMSQELRINSSFSGPLNFSAGVNYTRFENTSDYFVFINALSALVYGGDIYSGRPELWNGEWALLGTAAQGGQGGTMTVGCGRYLSGIEVDMTGNQRATCIYVQPGSIGDVASAPEGHNFFLSRNPFELNAASLFGELYYEVNDALKLTLGIRYNWDRKSFTPVPSQTLLADWRGRLEGGTIFDAPEILPPQVSLPALCDPRVNGGNFKWTLGQVPCALSGLAQNGRGYPSMPDIVQEWRVPTGRVGIDWKVVSGADWIDEMLLYAFYTRGYKAGGANPPTQSAPSGLLLAAAQGAAAPPTFGPEYVNAIEIGLKNRLFDGAMTINASAFFYDYSDYQVSKIVDRSAANENFDARVWGFELEAFLAAGPNTLFNASFGFLQSRIGSGERSLDLMDRTQGGGRPYVDPTWASLDASDLSCGSSDQHIACAYPEGFDKWILIRPTLTQASSCVAPAVLVYDEIQNIGVLMANDLMAKFCPGGRLVNQPNLPRGYNPVTSAPNGSAGFFADIGGNELPNAPNFTLSLGAQQTYWLPGGEWSATGRVDLYWQDKSFHRVYNTEYDRLKSWSNANLSLTLENDRHALAIEVYVKNAFDQEPITGAFLNSDDTGLSTNVFTLDPRLVGVSLRKRF